MDVGLTMKYARPSLTRLDYEVFDDSDGKGPYIKWYNKEIPEPTQAELETAWVEVQKIQQLESEKIAKKEAISKVASLSDQLNLLAEVLDIVTEGNTNPKVIYAKQKFAEIKDILAK